MIVVRAVQCLFTIITIQEQRHVNHLRMVDVVVCVNDLINEIIKIFILGNANRFKTKAECIERCITSGKPHRMT